jgi:predicted dithiol-disulfide oxidoreductase (DUF899 family)
LQCTPTNPSRASQVVSREEWVTARKDLLTKEKEAQRASDRLHEQMRDFPMVRIDKDYAFEGPDGQPARLRDLFGDCRQLVVYHFMLGPEQSEGCAGCSFLADHVPHLAHLRFRDTAFAAVSRAPQAAIAAFQTRMGWSFPWFSSLASDFNYDFHVTLDEAVAPLEYNYKDKAALERDGRAAVMKGELPGLSVFYRDGDEVFHTYSTYERGLERLLVTYKLLDITPLGRQEDDAGPKTEFRHHDKY